MAPVWLRFRAEFRARWVASLAVALLVGLAGGVTLAAVAGGRRTDTAFHRLLEKTNAADILVNPDNGTSSALRLGAVAELPQVAQIARSHRVLHRIPERGHAPVDEVHRVLSQGENGEEHPRHHCHQHQPAPNGVHQHGIKPIRE